VENRLADIIFSTGTCKKKEILTTMIELMKAAGWQNVSSNPATDFFVMHSKGESGDKNLYMQFRNGNVTNANPIDTTDYNVASYRLVGGYTPGSPGTAGVFQKATEAWRVFYVAPTTTVINNEVEMTYYYHVNKNRIIFVLETPISLGFSPVTHYFGLPVSFVSEPNSRGVIAASSTYAVTANNVLVSNAAGELPEDAVSSTRIVYSTLPPKSPNSAGIHTPVEMYYGNGTEGMRGKIDGLYVIPAGGVNNGDIMTVGVKRFKAIVNGVASSNSFPSTTLVCQVP